MKNFARWSVAALVVAIGVGTLASDAHAGWPYRRVVTSYSYPTVPVVGYQAPLPARVAYAPVVTAAPMVAAPPVVAASPVITAAPAAVVPAPVFTRRGVYYAPAMVAPAPVTTYYAPTVIVP